MVFPTLLYASLSLLIVLHELLVNWKNFLLRNEVILLIECNYKILLPAHMLDMHGYDDIHATMALSNFDVASSSTLVRELPDKHSLLPILPAFRLSIQSFSDNHFHVCKS